MYYDLNIQGRDHIHHTATLDTEPLTRHTTKIGHTLGLDYSYQHDNGLRLRLGGGYVFAGQNTPQTLSFQGAINYDF